MSDDLVTKVKMALESDSTPRVFHIRSVDALALVSCIKSLTSERDRLREALTALHKQALMLRGEQSYREFARAVEKQARAALKGETP